MNLLCRSLVLSASLFAVAAAIVFAVVLTNPPATPVSSTRGVEEALTSLDGRLGEVLERIDRLEGALAAFQEGLKTAARDTAAPSPSGRSKAFPAAKAGAPSTAVASTGVVDPEEAGNLREFVHQVIQEDREEQRQAEERRRTEEKRLFEELGQGPYGDFNLRVNCVARVLGFDDRQRQRYFEILSHYSTRLEEAGKGLNKLDPESLRNYEERKKEVLGEFEAVVIQALTPAQAQQYRELPQAARSPGSESTKTLMLLATRSG